MNINMDFVKEYRLIKIKYERFSTKLHHLITEILREHNIKYSAIEQRTKTVESLSEKIRRSGKFYTNPLEEITDLTGIRIILYYLDDLYTVRDIIEKEFTVDEDNSRDNKKVLNYDQFGYLSIHKIIKLKEPRASLSEWKELLGFVAEIQIRTVLQHAWASISHELDYKNQNDIPENLRRQLYRLSGLFELADEQFLEIKTKKGKYVQNVNNLLNNNNYSGIQINMDSLISYFLNSEVIRLIFSEIEKTKFNVYPIENNYNEKSVDRYRLSELIIICTMFSISTIGQLNSILISKLEYFTFYINLFIDKENIESKKNIFGPIEHVVILFLVVLFGTIEDKESIRKITLWNENYLVSAIELISKDTKNLDS